MNAIVDLDDVILDFHSAFLEYGQETLGIKMEASKHTYYSFYKDYGMTTDEFLGHVSTQDFLSRCKPFNNAKVAIDRLRGNGKKVFIVTARGYLPGANKYVMDFLTKADISVDEIIVTSDGIGKSFYYQKIGKIDLIIDDGFHNIEDAYKSNIVDNIYLINKPWNSLNNADSVNAIRVDCIEQAVNTYINR